ncbi:hydantoinase B/oxoprolinase family protein [Rubellimicrobium sp. CFH 75288]|uniref:hydantoinase B/oxoprolinase family protein n=1 Tax=Rubellimicrobium sp. CFH 75288 TaxID=2697034 RepID=UPI0014131E75|nr:hydantoinase B/oxoprolinase family protein [Rubellimicrobium sp. CFH 75288]NAZ35732.1 hydantoinase B/oxoprolinase family protein [Rubellimicrobium sp. CFH 75288]
MSVQNQIMWNRLVSIVEEQAQALVRTAFSTSVREAGDLSAGIYDQRGRMLAQAVTGTPGHVNAMAEAVRHFIREIGRDTMAPGDVYVTNDPWMGTGHLHDITVCTPVFHRDALVGFFACTAHVVDMGGRGFGAEGESLWEEGFQIPITRFADRGAVDRTLVALLRANVREPDQVAGDLYALAACNEVGLRRLRAMLDEYALPDIEALADFIVDSSYAATVRAIAALPRARASHSMVTDGYATPITLACTVETHPDRITCDFAGTSGPDPKGINVPLIYTQAYGAYALKIAVAPEVPNNAGSLAPFVVTAPEGTILNARRPAPVALRHVIGHLIPDTVFGALDQILPDTVPAEGAGALCNFQVTLRPHDGGRATEVLTFNSGGTGARPRLDGLNATAFPSGVMTMPVEATEHAGPVVVWRKELRPDSGGPGRFRGGLGQCMEVGPRPGHSMEFRAQFDRMRHPPRGRHGGRDGAPTVVELSDGTRFPAKARFPVPEGQTVRLAFPGGGGMGPPSERDAQAVARDVRLGYVSEEAARRDYGWEG